MVSHPQSPDISGYAVRPVVVVEFELVVDAAQGVAGAFDLNVIEVTLEQAKTEEHLVGGIHNRPQVGRLEETEQRYVSEVQFVLGKFRDNPFDWVKTSYFDNVDGKGPFFRRSLLTLPSYGQLVIVEAEAWGAGISINWDESIVVGLRPETKKMAEDAGVCFRCASEYFTLD